MCSCSPLSMPAVRLRGSLSNILSLEISMIRSQALRSYQVSSGIKDILQLIIATDEKIGSVFNWEMYKIYFQLYIRK